MFHLIYGEYTFLFPLVHTYHDGIYHFKVEKQNRLLLEIKEHYEPSASAGFYPGIIFVPETNILFIGAGQYVHAYILDSGEKLWDDEVNTGFWNWQRFGNTVVMSAELELAAWDIQGNKLWSIFVEPPWDYVVEGNTITVDVMGRKASFSLSGPDKDTLRKVLYQR
jgi:hypothetical protein